MHDRGAQAHRAEDLRHELGEDLAVSRGGGGVSRLSDEVRVWRVQEEGDCGVQQLHGLFLQQQHRLVVDGERGARTAQVDQVVQEQRDGLRHLSQLFVSGTG